MTTFCGCGESPSDRYYLQDARGYVGNDVLWWRPNGEGYTTDLAAAGIYSKAQSLGHRDTDHAWPVETIDPLTHRVVGIQRLPKERP